MALIVLVVARNKLIQMKCFVLFCFKKIYCKIFPRRGEQPVVLCLPLISIENKKCTWSFICKDVFTIISSPDFRRIKGMNLLGHGSEKTFLPLWLLQTRILIWMERLIFCKKPVGTISLLLLKNYREELSQTLKRTIKQHKLIEHMLFPGNLLDNSRYQE